MNLQSTGSFLPKNFTTLRSGSDGVCSSSSCSAKSPKSTIKTTSESSKIQGNAFNNKENFMLAMSGIEDDPLIYVRTQRNKKVL
jgi:hypothetical protein